MSGHTVKWCTFQPGRAHISDFRGIVIRTGRNDSPVDRFSPRALAWIFCAHLPQRNTQSCQQIPYQDPFPWEALTSAGKQGEACPECYNEWEEQKSQYFTRANLTVKRSVACNSQTCQWDVGGSEHSVY